MFEIDFKRLVAILLPTILRRPLLYGMLRAGVSGVEEVYSDFKTMRTEHVFRLTHNGQVCYLRGALNYIFGPGFRIGSMKREGEWLYAVTEDGENIPIASTEVGAGVPVMYSEQALNMAQNDFIVFVPSGLWFRLPEIEATVDRYKLITKRAHYVRVVSVGTSAAWEWKTNFNNLVEPTTILNSK